MGRMNPRSLEIAARETGEDSAQNSAKKASQAERIKAWRFQPGKSGNPGGRPKRDVASEIAQAVFEKNPEKVYEALAKRLTGSGDPYAFKELAERAYGKLKESLHVDGLEGLAEEMSAARKRASE